MVDEPSIIRNKLVSITRVLHLEFLDQFI